MPNVVPAVNAVAYSYIRFSSEDQRNGDSLRRQMELAAKWCEKNGVRLDESTRFHDLGKSAFKGTHRANPDRNALAAFLKLVDDGKIARGSYLLIESLDRLTREHIRPALTLLLNLIEAGIRVVQLKPIEVVYDDNVEPMQLMMALMELSRGNSESKVKSQRVGAAYRQKRDEARANRTMMTSKLPSWLEAKVKADSASKSKIKVSDKIAVLIPDRAAAVQRIFQLAAKGCGHRKILRRLEADNVPPFGNDKQRKDGKEPKWSITYIHEILNDRRVLGEYQPHCQGKADGPPIPHFYPAVVDVKEFVAARVSSVDRGVKCKPGPRLVSQRGQGCPGKDVANLFSHLIHDLRDGGSYWASTRTNRDKHGRRVHEKLLFNGRGKAGRAKSVTFNYRTFERAVLAMLNSIDADAVFPDAPALGNRTTELQEELTALRQHRDDLSAGLPNAGTAAADVIAAIVAVDAKIADVQNVLQQCEDQAAKPLAESLRDLQGMGGETPKRRPIRYAPIRKPGQLLAALDAVPESRKEEARLKLRSHLRRVIDRIHLLVVPKGKRGKTRYASVQIVFAKRADKDAPPPRYLDLIVVHKPSQHNGRGGTIPGRWWVWSNGLMQLGTPLAPPPADGLLSPEQLEYRIKMLPFDAERATEPEGGGGREDVLTGCWWSEEIPLAVR